MPVPNDGQLIAVFKSGVAVESGYRNAQIPTDDTFKTGAAKQNGGVADDYKVVRVTDLAHIERAENGDQYIIGEDGSVDFTPENARRFICATTDKTEIAGDGVEEATVTLQACLTNSADGTRGANDDAFAGDVSVAVGSPRGVHKTKATFVAGKATIKIKKRIDTDIGQWEVPVSFKTATAKADKQTAVVDILQDMG